ncbi:MAG: SusD/RagB family nutrient-binding outer membrane lipoprotein [Flavobacteriaceae bacterium]|nr:SusD/RagB family nutrient-binding outer membrane lipoprotein [Flavobacteriaceae bacterium]
MKFKKLINVLTILIVTVSLVSCEDFFDNDNADPNKPFDVPISAALPSVQLTIVDSYGGLWSNFGNMFIQQVEGVERQWESFNRYDIQPVRYNQSWGQMYENVFVELRVITEKATDGGLNHYLGIAKVTEAYALMMSSDVWGDIPYTEAGLGDANNNPAYDDHATVIMPAIRTLLTDALALFDGAPGSITPGSDDVLYGGDVDAWKLAAHGLLARYYLRLGDNANALAEAKMSLGSRADNMGFDYPGAGNDAPWFGFNDVRQGDIEFHPTMRGIMSGLNDTDRLGVLDNTFDGSHPYLTADQRQDILTYREMQFVIAETSTDAAEQHTAYLNGIRASFEEFGLGDAEYNSYVGQATIDPGAGNLTMEQIMTQKYIALFVQPEANVDWRRTGIPAITPPADATSTVVARRWFYPENEYLFNENAPARNSNLLFERVDWDN